jgi:hypothetical protein
VPKCTEQGTEKASRELKNWYFTTKCLTKHHL